ncbi:MAG: VCBS repeat-containing protein, partial [Planctomycetaceae bacterium]|nr:VCBS repeat-containing protein [Planctomycetaceae bacterium]
VGSGNGTNLSPVTQGSKYGQNSITLTESNLPVHTHTFDFVGNEMVPTNIVVTTAVDEDNGTYDSRFGTGTSLREAINAANANPDLNTITFQSGLGASGNSLVARLIEIDSDLPELTSPINIHGPGAKLLGLGGNGLYHLFQIGSSQQVEIKDLTLTEAHEDRGPAVRNFGTTTLSGLRISGNSSTTISSDGGGGIWNVGTLHLLNSTVDHNTAQGDGGGIWSNGTLNVINSTLSGNTANAGGGMKTTFNFGGVGVANITNSLIGFNNASVTAGGINASGGTVVINNSIIAGNTAGVLIDINGTVTGKNNIIGDAASSGGLTNGVNVNQVGVDWLTVLEPVLKDTGGSTPTHALVPDSPALNRGNNALAVDQNSIPLTTDQRGTGFSRIINTRVDIGPMEGWINPLTGVIGFANRNWWLTRPQSDGNYVTLNAASGPASVFQQVLQGDFNGDGLADQAAWLNNGEWRVALGTTSGNLTFTTWTSWTHPEIKEVHVGDFNGDGKDDIIGLFKNGTQGRWWVAISNGSSFENRVWGDYGNYDGIFDVLVGNFDGVNGDDLVVIATSGVVWMVKTSNSSFQYLNSHRWSINSGINGLSVGDFNGDGRDDVVAVFGTTRDRSIFVAKSLGPGDGFASIRFTGLTVADSLDKLVVGDFDGDGRDDIATLLNKTKWWVGIAGINLFTMRFWGNWSFASNGVSDIHVGSTNRDGRSDILGRANNGQWYAAESTGAAFNSRVIKQWSSDVTWLYVNGGNYGLGDPPTENLVLPPAVSKLTQSTAPEVNTSRWGQSTEGNATPDNNQNFQTGFELSVSPEQQMSPVAYELFGHGELLELLFDF